MEMMAYPRLPTLIRFGRRGLSALARSGDAMGGLANPSNPDNSLVQVLDLEVVVPLGVVEVAFGPLDFAALEVHGVAAGIFLRG